MDILSEVRACIKDLTSLNEMLSTLNKEFGFSYDVSKELIILCAFADVLESKRNMSLV